MGLAWQPLQCSCLKNPHGHRSLAGYSPWDHKHLDTIEWLSLSRNEFTKREKVYKKSSQEGTRNHLFIYLFIYLFIWLPGWLSGKELACQWRRYQFDPGREDPLEKEMATHSSILAWIIPWIEGPGRLQTMGVEKELDLTEASSHSTVTKVTCILLPSLLPS